jgi:hypothetical protein
MKTNLKATTKLVLLFVALPSILMMYQNCGQKAYQFGASGVTESKARPSNLDAGAPTPEGSGAPTPDGSSAGGVTGITNPTMGIDPGSAFGPGIGSTNLTLQEIDKLCPSIPQLALQPSVPNAGGNKGSTEHIMSSGLGVINDLLITGSNNSEILGNVLNLKIENTSGNVVAKVDHLIEISNLSGNARIAANNSGNLLNVSGNICLSTNGLGDIYGGQSGNLSVIGPKGASGKGGNISGRSGNTYISNLDLGEVQMASGNLVVSGGSIQILVGGSGNILLDNVQVGSIDATSSGRITLINGSTAKSIVGSVSQH